MVEARAHVRITRFSRVVFSLAILWARFWSMNGPFLSERLTYRSSSSRAALVRCSLPTTATPHPTKSSIPGVPTKPASWGGSGGRRGLPCGRLDQGFALPLLLTPRNLRFRGDPEGCHTGGSIKASHLPLLPSPDDQLVRRLFRLSRAQAKRRLAPRGLRVAAGPGLTLAAAVRVVGRIHGRTSHRRPCAHPARASRLATGLGFVLQVAHLAQRGHAPHVDAAQLA